MRIAICIILCGCAVAHAEDRRETTVGMTGRIDQIVLPGPELEAKPLHERGTPVVVRIINSYPHGTAFRYDLSYYVLEPGTFDLKDYLRRKDGSSTQDVPSLRVTAKPLLPAGQVKPNPLKLEESPWLGGYRLLLWLGGTVWVVGLLCLLFLRRRRQKVDAVQSGKALTMADHLKPLVERGMAGKLSPRECADLERTLLAYWRKRLRLGDQKPVETFATLRKHPEAGPFLNQLEDWLHRPGMAEHVDVAKLLEPYSRDTASEEGLKNR
jgi:hypothetical protein